MHPALVDLVIVTAGMVLAAFGATVLNFPFPGQLGVLTGVLLSTWRMKRRSESWTDVGLRTPGNPLQIVLPAFGLYLLTLLGVLLIVNPVSKLLGWPPLDVSAFAGLEGNTGALVRMLILIWTIVAFGEEMVFRGFVLRRIHELLGPGQRAAVLAVATQSVLFGLGHFYLGARGVLTAAVVGAVYGAWFLARDRNLWPLILAHGLTDTISIAAIYSGAANLG
jgi:membrane protease YdiL (CAAX protease family)